MEFRITPKTTMMRKNVVRSRPSASKRPNDGLDDLEVFLRDVPEANMNRFSDKRTTSKAEMSNVVITRVTDEDPDVGPGVEVVITTGDSPGRKGVKRAATGTLRCL